MTDTRKEYRADPRPSQSDLKAYWVSPKAGDYQRANPIKQTAAMALGEIVHDLVLMGPSALEKYRTDSPINEKTGEPYGETTKSYAVWKCDVEASGQVAANAATIAKAKRMADSLTAEAREIIAACDHIEEPIYWTEGGVEMKGRPDAWKTGEYLVEIKTTSKPLTERALAWEAKTRLYDLQCTAYRNGVGGLKSSVIIWISEANGGDSAIMWLDDDAGWLDGGQRELDKAIENFKLSGSGIGCAPDVMRPKYPVKEEETDMEGIEEENN